MKEVIAKSASEVKPSSRIYLLLGIILLFFGICSLFIPLINLNLHKGSIGIIIAVEVCLIIGGIVFLILAGFTWNFAKEAPSDVITYLNGTLKFADGFSCRIEEVTNVKYSPDIKYVNHIVFFEKAVNDTTGSLMVSVGGITRRYSKIENVEKAHNRLIELMLQCREKGNGNNGNGIN